MESVFANVMPVIEKAAPLIAQMIEKKHEFILVGLLALLYDCEPHDMEKIRERIENDQDFYLKISNINRTHTSWMADITIDYLLGNSKI